MFRAEVPKLLELAVGLVAPAVEVVLLEVSGDGPMEGGR